MVKETFIIKGTVLSRFTGTGIAGLRVEAWDRERRIQNVLGVATTDDNGEFEIEFNEKYYQEICKDRKPDIYFRVFSGKELIVSTEEDVLWNVKRWPLQVTISVELLPGEEGRVRPKRFTVKGRVAKPDGSPLAGLRVVALERDPKNQERRGERVLGTTRTDKGGYYAIHYTTDKLANPAKGSADLVVRVYDDKSKTPLAASPLILNALEEEIINLSIGEETYRGRSEYEVVAERLEPILERVNKTEYSDQDIAYFSNQTGLTIQQVQLYAESQKQAKKAKLDASILYALYRTGMPYSLAALTVQNPEAINASLKLAQEKNIISLLEDEGVARVVESLQTLSVRELLDSDSPARVHAAKLFELAGLSAREKAAALKTFSANPDSLEKFWESLQKMETLSKKKLVALRRIFQFNALSLNHTPLVEKLVARKEIKSIKELAPKDFEVWKAFLKQERIAAPEQVPGNTPTEKQANYALILARIMEDSFPTAFFANSWSRDNSLDQTITKFFMRNPDFAFESKGINTYLKEYSEALDGIQDKNAIFKLQALQNLFRIGPRFERFKAVRTLWLDKARSAYAIKRMGEKKFVYKYEKTIGKAQAQIIYAKAEKVAGFTLLALAKYAWDTNAITPYVIPKTDLFVTESESGRAILTELFGNLDFCHCEHCRSVLGPAAYLVDLLAFLNNATAKDGGTGLEKLFARRPDIGNIKLSCENTNIPLPYIDLVNEVLEDAIVPRTYTAETYDGTSICKGEVYQTDENNPEFLRAHPEHLNRYAYDKVVTATYPWTLPFNLWAEEARVYLAQLGVKRHELMEVLSGSGAASPTETEVLCEALGLSSLERAVLTTPVTNATQLRTLWGVKAGSLMSAVKKAFNFLDRAKITYPQLEQLLQCRFINPPVPILKIRISFDEDNPCSLDHAELTNLTPKKLDRLHRFIRLRQKLNWSFLDLDKALTAFGTKLIDDDFLQKLSLTIQLKERLGVDLLTALSWWSAKLDTMEYKDTPSQYAELFLNPTMGDLKKEVRNTLTLNAAGNELSATDKTMTSSDYEPVILGATRIRKDDLAVIIVEDLGNDSTLNLESLSHVFRVASFSQALGLSVEEYYTLKKLSGIQPVSSPAHSATPQETKVFLEAKKVVAESGINLAELAYLLAHDTSMPNNGQMPEQVIGQRLTEIRTNLAGIHAAHQMPREDLETVLAGKLGDLAGLDRDLVDLEKEENRNAVLRVVFGQSPLSEAEQKALIDKYFSKFLNAADAKDKLVGPVNALGYDLEARLKYVLEPLLAYLFPRQVRRYLEQKLAESLTLSVAAASALLDAVKSPTDSSQSAQDVFLEEAFVIDTDPMNVTAHASQFGVYERIYKTSCLLNRLKIGPNDQAFIVRRGFAVGWPDISALPLTELNSGPVLAELFERFAAMVRVFQVWPRIRTSGVMLSEFLSEVMSPGVTEAQIKQLLAQHTAWSLDDIETLTANYGFGLAAVQKSVWLVQLYNAFSILKRLGVRAAQAWSWNTADVIFDQATQMKLAVKSKYNSKEWLSIAPALRDPLREKQRDALLAYVIHEGVVLNPLRPEAGRKYFKDADDVYGYLLIDPQMSACMDTSRIKQAISSVQLFVQRILMNLEVDEIEYSYADAKQWKWRKNYRIWEANRKVFLWPENWIYPDLRDDKSPFFKELEDELYQSDIDNDSAECAIMSYLKKLDEVAHLEVSGLYEEIDEDAGKYIFHVVARTRSTPHKYFYRRWMNKQYWTAWERVEADIEGDHLIPVVHNRRLFLFWPKFIEKAWEVKGSEMADVRKSDERPDDPLKYYEIRIAWTQYRDGKWRETQVSTDFLMTLPSKKLKAKEQFYFFEEQDERLLLYVTALPYGEIPTLARSDLQFDDGGVFLYNDANDAIEAILYKDAIYAIEAYPGARRIYLTDMNRMPDSDNIFMAFEKTARHHELTLLTKADVDDFGTVVASTTKKAKILTRVWGKFQLMLPHQYEAYISQAPFFFSDSFNVFFVKPRDIYLDLASAGVAGAFILPEKAYFTDAAIRIQKDCLFASALPELIARLRVRGEGPFFDSDRAYYAGNKPAGMVIDRTRTKVPGYGRTSVAAGSHSPRTLYGSTGNEPAPVVAAQPATFEHTRGIVDSALIEEIMMGIDREALYGSLTKLGQKIWLGKRYQFQLFFHPFVPLMIQQLNRYGVAGLFAPNPDHGSDWEKLKRQQVSWEFFKLNYHPNPDVVNLDDRYRPKRDFDFSFGGAYSQYNWELFFHAPLLIAERLMQNQKFEEAQKWFHYIFDPTETEGEAPERFWKIKPFYEYSGETSIEELMELLNKGDEEMEAQVEAWENDPFNPHLISRMRIVAYMRTVAMKYLDNLIAWGDSLFRRGTMESLNEAAPIYVLAAQILGRKPERIRKTDVSAYTFNELLPELDEFSNARVSVESSLPWMTTHRSGPSSEASGVLDTLYFCIPQNEKFLGYWDTVADRLFKIRHCMTIEGVVRKLPLFEPPIDPGLLVKARAMGLELSSILADLSAPLPYYRSRIMLQRANEFCADVRSLGAALLQTLEKRDEAALTLLRATHQVDLLKALRVLKVKTKEEAEHQKNSLIERQQLAKIRKEHYEGLAFMNPLEIAGMALHEMALIPQGIGTIGELLSAIFALVPLFDIGITGVGGTPNVKTMWGGQNIASSAAHMNSFQFQMSSMLNSIGSIIDTLAAYQRRQEEWGLQIELATKEMDDFDKQILAAQARIELTNADLKAHDKQIIQAEAEAEFLDSRFTNKELYNWMVTQISTLYFQTYQMAYDLAKKAEQSFRHELGIRDSNYIQFGYWDSLKKGLLAGEWLQKDLKRLEAAYLEMNRREFELTKHISLAQLNPIALLQLKQTGKCEFMIPEILFDLDHPGHYMRRIKAVSITIPCVVGPYTSVAAKLTMLENRIRTISDTMGDYTYKGLDDLRFVHDLVGIQSIATSTGQRDPGLFELSFGDERYLPFEGAGVVSRWRLELPEDYRQFDYDTISDVILHIQFTARDGGDPFKVAVQGELRQSLNKIADILAASETGLTRIISSAHEFSTEWHRFMYPSAAATSQELTLKPDKRLFPFMLKDRRLDIREITIVLMLDDPTVYDEGSNLSITFTHPDGSQTKDDLTRSSAMGGQPSLTVSSSFALDQDPIAISLRVDDLSLSAIAPALIEERDGKKRLSSGQAKDMLLVINFTIAS